MTAPQRLHKTLAYLAGKVTALHAVARVQADPVRDRDHALSWISDDLARMAAILQAR
jgi:hypothetical protein